MPANQPKAPVREKSVRDKLLALLAPSIGASMPVNGSSPSSLNDYARLSNPVDPTMYSPEELRQLEDFRLQNRMRAGTGETYIPEADQGFTNDQMHNRNNEWWNKNIHSPSSASDAELAWNSSNSPERMARQDSSHIAEVLRKLAMQRKNPTTNGIYSQSPDVSFEDMQRFKNKGMKF